MIVSSDKKVNKCKACRHLSAENKRLRTALEACRQHVRIHHNSSAWHNDPTVWELVTDHIDPALGTNTD